MIPKLPWLPHYDEGLVHLRCGNVDRALEAFDEVYRTSDGRYQPLRPRAEVLAQLDGLLPAHLARPLCPHRLFNLIGKQPLSFQTWILLPASTTVCFPTKYSALKLAETLVNRFKARRALVDHLPPEVMTLVGQFAVDDMDSSDVILNFSNVSRRWRSIFSEDSRLWGHVVLNVRDEPAAVDKANFFLSRRRAHHLEVDYGSKQSTKQPPMRLLTALHKSSSQLARLHTLVLRSPEIPIGMVFDLAGHSPVLNKLVIYLSDVQSAFKPGLHPSLPSVRHLALRRGADFTPKISHLGLITQILPFLPNLEELEYDHPACTLFAPSADNSVVHLNRLRRLNIQGSILFALPWSLTIWHGTFIFPSLRELEITRSIKESYIPYLFPPNQPPNTQHLTRLVLRDSDVVIRTLIGHLASIPSLIHLDVRSRSHPYPLALMLALAKPAACGEDDGARTSRLCPLLEELLVTAPAGAGLKEEFYVACYEAVEVRPAGQLEVSSWTTTGTKQWVCPPRDLTEGERSM